MLNNLLMLQSANLLHACTLEDQPAPKCKFVTDVTDVREERQVVQQKKTIFKCVGQKGNYFLVSATCLSLPVGVI